MYRRFLRPGWIVGHLLVVLAVLTCLRLGLWQWHRTHDANGTVQNLGYAVLWPVFGAAFVYMWFRFLHLELLKDAEDDAELAELAAGEDPAADTRETFEPVGPPQTELTPADIGSAEVAPTTGESRPTEVAADQGEPPSAGFVPAPSVPRRTPSRGVTVAVSTVGDDDEDEDPELAAYNRALAALAEKDHRRAR